jgi:hypothetical protein
MSYAGICQVIIPFLYYHWGKGDDDYRYMFPASISHTIRRPTKARYLYQILYLWMMVELYTFAKRRQATGAMATFTLLVIGSLHVFVPIPEPHEREGGTKTKAFIKEITHYGKTIRYGVCIALQLL